MRGFATGHGPGSLFRGSCEGVWILGSWSSTSSRHLPSFSICGSLEGVGFSAHGTCYRGFLSIVLDVQFARGSLNAWLTVFAIVWSLLVVFFSVEFLSFVCVFAPVGVYFLSFPLISLIHSFAPVGVHCSLFTCSFLACLSGSKFRFHILSTHPLQWEHILFVSY